CPATRFARELQVESLAEHHTTRLKTHEVETFLNHFDHLTSLQLGANYSEFDWRILRNESLLKLHRLTVYGEYLLIRDERALCEILTFCTESAHCAASERVLKFFALATPVEFAEDVARVLLNAYHSVTVDVCLSVVDADRFDTAGFAVCQEAKEKYDDGTRYVSCSGDVSVNINAGRVLIRKSS
ncbi:hypothetical protein AAVH_33204, partial [Aphelenchoides avenae]